MDSSAFLASSLNKYHAVTLIMSPQKTPIPFSFCVEGNSARAVTPQRTIRQIPATEKIMAASSRGERVKLIALKAMAGSGRSGSKNLSGQLTQW